MITSSALSAALLTILVSAVAATPASALTIARGGSVQAFDSRQGRVAYVTAKGNALSLRVRAATGRTRVVARSRTDESAVLQDFADLRAGSDARGATVFVFSRGKEDRHALWVVDAASGGARRLRTTDRAGRGETLPSAYAGRLGYFAGSRLVTSSMAGGPEQPVKLDRGAGNELADAAIGPGFFLVDIVDPFEGESSAVGVLRGGRFNQVFSTPNGEESSATVDYMNVLDGQLHATVTSNIPAADGQFRAPLSNSRSRRQRATLVGEQGEGASPFSGDTFVQLRRAGGRTDLVTRRLSFRR